jgi:hypothetical protein
VCNKQSFVLWKFEMQRIGDNVNKTSFNYAFTRMMDARHREHQMVLSIGNYYKAINKTKPKSQSLHVAALLAFGATRGARSRLIRK